MMNADTDVTFSDMNFSERRLVDKNDDNIFRKKGWFVTRRKAVVIFLVIVLLCIIIGVSVHYANKRSDKQPFMHQTTPAPQESVTSPKPNVTWNIRLPEALKPVHYDVNIRPDIYGGKASDFKFTGSVKIILDVKTDTKDIILHSNKLSLDKDKIKVLSNGDKNSLPVDYGGIEMISHPYEFLKIPMKSALEEGRQYSVQISFSGKIENDLRGIYYSSYEMNGETVYLLTSQLQATDARKVFPCFDEPALKATFNISIERKATMQTKSNTIIVRNETLKDGWVRDVYESTPPMSTYLLAFLVSDFKCKTSQTATGTLIEVCARPTAYNQLDYALSIGVDIQEWFEWYHNISYPLSKMSHVAVPDFSAGAMENWGLILYRETALLYDAVTTPSAYSRQRVALVVSHELAHQWFGNLVTTEWWDDIWLNEGFASFMELLGVHNIKNYTTWNVEGQNVGESLQKVMVEDSLISSHPVYQPVTDPADIGSLFDSITYDKGSAVIRMMKYFLGDETFRWGLSDYLKARQFKAADHNDLFTFLTQRAKKDGKTINVTAIMNTWILQEGYPVVDFSFKPGDPHIEVTQQRFLINPNATKALPESKLDFQWMVPLTYMSDKTTAGEVENLTVYWLNNQQYSIPDVAQDTQWVLGNVRQAFYYRVNYDKENWNALVDVLRTNHSVIPATSRSQLIDDSFKLGRSGLVDQLLALNLTLYLNNEQEYPPWYSVYKNIEYLERMLYQMDSDHLLQKYIQGKISSLYNKYSVEGGSESYSHIERRLQTLLWSTACKYELKSCLENASNQYRAWMEAEEAGEKSSINPDYASVVYCYGIAQGGIKEWDFGYKMYMTSNSGSQKDSLLTALGCSKTPWILQRYLMWALDEGNHGFQRQDMRRIISGIATRPSGSHIAWGFFKAEWDVFFERFGRQSFSFSRIIQKLTSRFSTEWEAQNFEEFFALHLDQGTATRQVKQCREEIKTNIEWKKNHEENIMTWLKENV